MRKSRFTEEQITGMIKEQEAGLPTAGCRLPKFAASTDRRPAQAGSLALRLQQCQAALIVGEPNASTSAPASEHEYQTGRLSL